MEDSQSKQQRAIRGKSFSMDEDVALCKSWLTVIHDHGQKQSIFWNRILEQYKTVIISPNERSPVSLQSRWQTIMVSLKKFYGFLEQIELRHGNGMLEADKIVQAKVIYYETEKKNFVFEHIWAIVRNDVKFQEYMGNKKRKIEISSPSTPPTSSPSTPSASVSLDSNVDPDNVITEDLGKRSIGWKIENELPRKNKKVDSMLESVTSNSKMIVDLLQSYSKSQADKEQRKSEARAAKLNMLAMLNEREQRKEEDEIMLKDTSNMSDSQKVYYAHRQAEILARIQARKDVDLSSL